MKKKIRTRSVQDEMYRIGISAWCKSQLYSNALVCNFSSWAKNPPPPPVNKVNTKVFHQDGHFTRRWFTWSSSSGAPLIGWFFFKAKTFSPRERRLIGYTNIKIYWMSKTNKKTCIKSKTPSMSRHSVPEHVMPCRYQDLVFPPPVMKEN